MKALYNSSAPGQVQLEPGLFRNRYELNNNYILSLKSKNLLQNYYHEAGIGNFKLRNTILGDPVHEDDLHWGWESPTCQLRGHFLGHWLSAAARNYANTGDLLLRQRIDEIISELGRCQEENGGEWVFSIPEKYLDRIAAGKRTWAPQYTIHKTLMGLADVYKYSANEQALTILKKAANWFYRWTSQFTREQMADVLDFETGGMLEVWADLYGVTGEKMYLELLARYYRHRLFDKLLDGKDMLTNMHANTTIPEVLGAARAYEVTGDDQWRRIVESYWRWAVDERGTFCTGGQTSGEIWTPPFEFAARRGDKNQEHCTVYNMIRLADFLFRWSGEAKYLDYVERNIYNGILAQQNPHTGMISYFLPLEGGAHKPWGTPHYDFWCCHGSLVQAHSLHNAYIYYTGDKELVISQYIPSRLTTEFEDTRVEVRMELEGHKAPASADSNGSPAGHRHRPKAWLVTLKVESDRPVDFALRVRLPVWVQEKAYITVNGTSQSIEADLMPGEAEIGFYTILRTWHHDTLHLEFPKKLSYIPIPDEPNTVAFLDGPVVLAGLCEREIKLTGDLAKLEQILVPDNERQWRDWLPGYRTVGQSESIRLKPLYEVVDEAYTVYFPVE